jgi:ABC-type Zn uptake system ZnuABC Zn-binding protein ZnuA
MTDRRRAAPSRIPGRSILLPSETAMRLDISIGRSHRTAGAGRVAWVAGRPRRAGPPSRRSSLIVAAALLVAACSSGVTPAPSGAATAGPDPDALQVVTTTTVLADLVAQVGGTRVAVHSLVPKGGEVHTFDPTPSDARKITEADVIFMNGLGLDDWLADLASDTGTTAPIVALAEGLDGVDYIGGTTGQGAGSANPHLWMNVAYGKRYVERIVEALSTAAPVDAAAFTAHGTAYLGRLADLDAWVREQVASVPAADRRVVSFHDAFPYYAAAYGLEIVGTVVDAPGQDPSAGEVGDLVEAIRADGVKAIFSEIQFSDDLAQTIADETGATVVSDLYDDTLGDPPLDSYEGIIRWDTDRILAALTSPDR